MQVENVEYLKDSRGALVPRSMVKEIDILRNEVVLNIVRKAVETNKALIAFKSSAMNDVNAFVELSAEQYGVKIGGSKGNITLHSFDGEFRISKSINDYIVFDERLQVAKQLIDDYIKERFSSTDTDDDIKVIVNYAFQVDKTGKISTDRILGLRRLNITNATWKKAMDAIAESIQITGSKEYIRIYKRDAGGNYHLINLDLAAI